MDIGNLNLLSLKYFCDAVSLGGVSASARANFVTQSAISQSIAKLETTLGCALVAHHPNKFRLTPEGEMAFRQALEIIQQAANFKATFTQSEQPLTGDLEFSCTYSFVLAVLTPYLKRFRQEHPQVKVNFGLGKNSEIKQLIRSGAIDFGILPDEGDLEEFQKRDIYEGTFNLYVSRKIPPEGYGQLGIIFAPAKRREMIKNKNEVKAALKQKLGKEPKVIMEVGSWEVIVNLVAEGMGMSYFPDFFGNAKASDLKKIDLDIAPYSYRMSAISPPGMKLRLASEIFLSYFPLK